MRPPFPRPRAGEGREGDGATSTVGTSKCASASAATSPAGPPPITATEVWSGVRPEADRSSSECAVIGSMQPFACHCDRGAGSYAPVAASGSAAMTSSALPRLKITLASTFLLAACGQDNHYVAPPQPRVTVAVPLQQPVTRYLEATGNTAAVNSADLVARVSGFIQEINYQDGALVKKGALLFTIEPEPYKVKLDQAKAAEDGARSALKQAQAAFERQAELVGRQAASQANYDQALATRDSSQSTLTQAEANTRLAALNFEYAHVTAPFDGIVTARQVSVGQFVGAGASPTLLATIIQHDPIYVNFNVSEQDVLHIRADMARRGLTSDDLKRVPV